MGDRHNWIILLIISQNSLSGLVARVWLLGRMSHNVSLSRLDHPTLLCLVTVEVCLLFQLLVFIGGTQKMNQNSRRTYIEFQASFSTVTDPILQFTFQFNNADAGDRVGCFVVATSSFGHFATVIDPKAASFKSMNMFSMATKPNQLGATWNRLKRDKLAIGILGSHIYMFQVPIILTKKQWLVCYKKCSNQAVERVRVS